MVTHVQHLFRFKPTFLAATALGLSILLTLFPPELYSEIVQEPNLMFGDFRLIAYLLLCVGGFGVGSISFRILARNKRGPSFSPASPRVVVAVALIGALIGVLALEAFIGDSELFLSSLVSGSGDEIRSSTGDEGALPMIWNAMPLGVGLFFWALAQVALSKTMRPLLRLVVYAAAAAYAICLAIALQRNLLIPFLIGCLITMSAMRWHPHGLTGRQLFWLAFGSCVVALGIFLAIGYFRSGATESPTAALVGYIPASLNRLSAALNGSLESAFPGGGYHTFKFFWHPPLVRRFIDMQDVAQFFGTSIPLTAIEGWRSEFEQIASAKLNPMFIWPTAFGYAFFDFGWVSPLYFTVYGFVAAYLWRKFTERNLVGLVLYPYVGSAILLWPTDNFLSYPQIVLVLAAVVMVQVVNRGGALWSATLRANRAAPRMQS